VLRPSVNVELALATWCGRPHHRVVVSKDPCCCSGGMHGSGGTGRECATRLQLAVLDNTAVGSYSMWRSSPDLVCPMLESWSLPAQLLHPGSTQSLRVAFPAACGAHRSRQRDRRLAHHRLEIGSPPQYPVPWGGDPLFGPASPCPCWLGIWRLSLRRAPGKVAQSARKPSTAVG
jgi:hypothetical protein